MFLSVTPRRRLSTGVSAVEIAFSAGAWATDEQRTILGHVLDKATQLGIKISVSW